MVTKVGQAAQYIVTTDFFKSNVFKIGGLLIAAQVLVRIAIFTEAWSGGDALAAFAREISVSELTTLALIQLIPTSIFLFGAFGYMPTRSDSQSSRIRGVFTAMNWGVAVGYFGLALVFIGWSFTRPLLPKETVWIEGANGDIPIQGYVIEDSGRWMKVMLNDRSIIQLEIDRIKYRDSGFKDVPYVETERTREVGSVVPNDEPSGG